MSIREYKRTNLRCFQKESNWIEGIYDVREEEIDALIWIVSVKDIRPEHLIQYVNVVQPDAVLREFNHIPGVRVGNHIAPRSGPEIRKEFEKICSDVNNGAHRSVIHHRYETLHPFTDGNGRSGRALWLWQFVKDRQWVPDSFLRWWYYESLAENEARSHIPAVQLSNKVERN